MVENVIVATTVVAALGSGLMAGVFFAFSAFVMKTLSRLRPDAGIAAMQAINITMINPLFLGVFIGTAVACVLVGAKALIRWETVRETYGKRDRFV